MNRIREQGEDPTRPLRGDQVEIGHATTEYRVSLAELVVNVQARTSSRRTRHRGAHRAADRCRPGLRHSNICSTMRHHGEVAGGMARRSSWGTMADRVASSAPMPPPPEAPSTVARLKHCWVVDDRGRLPALLLEWRRTEAGFRGRVVRPVEDLDLGWIVVEEWLPAELLEPA
ncbi:hypothetical protein K1X13_05405 [Nocardioides sp. WL0053]|uniref:Uncharacterized protein n=1 Tax=Nocardioides jiangsuensis TaxID=2866161 RepID=A0ABS7RGS7_9ACTN|nr:hypothetical protein [Nocardioides jiangsuensis]MBY9074255.1 hypothetical protein [Nocardioides jiangsuensis]